MARKEPNPLRRRRRIRQLTGAVVCLLVIIGIGSVIMSGIRGVALLTDDTDERLAFESRLSSLVPYDPLPFEVLAQAKQDVLLTASIWGTLGEIDQSVLERDDIDQPYLPTVDVDRWAAKLFGPDYKLKHETYEDHGVIYTYVEEKQAYLIPITSAMMDYSPRVVKIKKEGKTKRVTVGYLSPFTPGGELNLSGVLEPVKYLDYIFTKNNKDYFLSAITESETKAPEQKPSTATQSSPLVPIDPGAFIEENAQASSSLATSTAQAQSTASSGAE